MGMRFGSGENACNMLISRHVMASKHSAQHDVTYDYWNPLFIYILRRMCKEVGLLGSDYVIMIAPSQMRLLSL